MLNSYKNVYHGLKINQTNYYQGLKQIFYLKFLISYKVNQNAENLLFLLKSDGTILLNLISIIIGISSLNIDKYRNLNFII